MKKHVRRTALVLAIILILSIFPVQIFAAGPSKISTISEAMAFVGSEGKITIRRGTLYENGNAVDTVYVIGLVGTNGSLDASDINSVYACILSGMSMTNSYVREVVKRAQQAIPSGSKVLLIGHSLGGMVAQQVAANRTMKKQFQILNTLTMGSPYIMAARREGSLHRMADRADVIPFLSLSCLANAWAGNVSFESSGWVAPRRIRNPTQRVPAGRSMTASASKTARTASCSDSIFSCITENPRFHD